MDARIQIIRSQGVDLFVLLIGFAVLFKLALILEKATKHLNINVFFLNTSLVQRQKMLH